MAALLVLWLAWISYTVAQLESDMQLIKFRLFNKVTLEVPASKPSIMESDMNFFRIFKLKKEN